MDDIQYYYLQNDQQIGPFDLETFKRQPLTADTLVWHTGLADWTTASQLNVLDGVIVANIADMTSSGIEIRNASFFERLAAFLFDNIIMAVPSFFILPFLLKLFGIEAVESLFPEEGDNLTDFYTRQLASSLLSALLFTCYEAFFYLRPNHTTPGKRMLGLYVMTDQYTELTTSKALMRSFGRIVTGFTCLIGYIISVYDNKNKTLHDYLAGTAVVKVLK